MIVIEGRDYSADLMSANSQMAFVNQTSLEVVLMIAQRHGLTAILDASAVLTGNFDTTDTRWLTLAQSSRCITDWDILSYVANMSTCDLYLVGRQLYFSKSIKTNRPSFLIRKENLISLRLERTLVMANDFEVTVKSWNSWLQDSLTVSKSLSQGSPNTASQAANKTYIITKPNLTFAEAQNLAERKHSDVGLHEWTVAFQIPGEINMTTRDNVYLAGTDTDFDRVYQISSIERQVAPSTGFVQNVEAKATTPAAATS